MSWGTKHWGEIDYWGGKSLGVVSGAYYWHFMRDTPMLRAIADTIDAGFYRHEGLVAQLLSKFNLENADGDLLDKLASWLYIEREGLDDARMRRAIRVMVASVLSSGGTADGLINVWTAWTGYTPFIYETTPPNHVNISGQVNQEDEQRLLELLYLTKPAGVRVHAVTFYDTPLILDCAAAPLSSATALDCAQAPVTGAGTLGIERQNPF